jgi:hypothetical protein
MLASLGCHYHDSPAATKAVLTIDREQHNSCGCMIVRYVKQGMSLCLAAAAHHLAVDSSKAPGGSSPPQWKRTQQSCRCWRSLWCGSCGLGAVDGFRSKAAARQKQAVAAHAQNTDPAHSSSNPWLGRRHGLLPPLWLGAGVAPARPHAPHAYINCTICFGL